MRARALPWLDLAALVWFFAWWVGYTRFAKGTPARSEPAVGDGAVTGASGGVRMIERVLRHESTPAIIANLTTARRFFASSTAADPRGHAGAPWHHGYKSPLLCTSCVSKGQTSELVWVLKILLLVAIFVYAFFKFTGRLRQFNMRRLLVGLVAKVPREAKTKPASPIARGVFREHLAPSIQLRIVARYYFALPR
jgi:uncharacterized membrane protein